MKTVDTLSKNMFDIIDTFDIYYILWQRIGKLGFKVIDGIYN